MYNIKNNSGDLITNSYGAFLESVTDILMYSNSGFESRLRYFSENRREKMCALCGVQLALDGANRDRVDFNSLLRNFYPVLPIKDDSLRDWVGGGLMTSSGDHSYNYAGISGDGTYYFSNIYNFNSIADSDNFSFGLYVQGNSNTGTDFGARDGANYVTIATRSGGTTTVNIGTASDSFATSDSTGHWVVNVRGGNFTTYLNGVEVGTSTAVAGSLPNAAAFLGAYADGGTATDHSDKTYSALWIYDGQLSESNVLTIDKLIRGLHETYNRNSINAL